MVLNHGGPHGWATRQRLAPGQEAVAGKGDEITAIPLLPERLELTGALVTIDAIGCQRDIAKAIRAKGADYLLALKDNWPTLAEEARLCFAREPTGPAGSVETVETVDGDHGRIETRRARVRHDVGWLTTNRRFPGEPRFPDPAMIGMVEAEVERNGRVSVARSYFLGSARLTARDFARAARAHWGVENRLHWVMDVVFHDASCGSEPKTAPPTWPPSDTPPSTSSGPSPTRPASKSDGKARSEPPRLYRRAELSKDRT